MVKSFPVPVDQPSVPVKVYTLVPPIDGGTENSSTAGARGLPPRRVKRAGAAGTWQRVTSKVLAAKSARTGDRIAAQMEQLMTAATAKKAADSEAGETSSLQAGNTSPLDIGEDDVEKEEDEHSEEADSQQRSTVDSDEEADADDGRQLTTKHEATMAIVSCVLQLNSAAADSDNEETNVDAAAASLRRLSDTLQRVELQLRYSLAPLFAGLELVQLCQNICSACLGRRDLDDVRLQPMLSALHNLTDASAEVCQQVLDTGLYRQIFSLVAANELNADEFNDDPTKWLMVIYNVFGILHNVIQAQPAARELYREQDALHITQKYRKNPVEIIAALSLILQAYVINEDENELIASDGSSFYYLTNELQTAAFSANHRSSLAFAATELLEAINKLAVNDDNKAKIVEFGAVASYVQLLRADCSLKEQTLATQGLWTLAKRCGDDVRQTDGCVEALKALLKSTDDDNIRIQVQGVLDELGLTDKADSQTLQEFACRGKIFISYSHKSLPEIVHRIKDQLKIAGFDVWIDSEQIHKGQTLAAAIAQGIDDASIVIVCISQAYYESPYCQRECTYAHDNKKEIIPICMEPRYNPHGWLQLLVGGGFRHDFSNSELFDESMKKMLDSINESPAVAAAAKINIAPVDHVDGRDWTRKRKLETVQPTDIKATISPQLKVSPSHGNYSTERESEAKSWQREDVVSWLNANGLQRAVDWFSEHDGTMLLEYAAVRERHPESWMQLELERGKLSVTDVLKLNAAFRKL